MKNLKILFQSIFLFTLIFAASSLTFAQSNNSIYGQVFDPQTRLTIENIFVELTDELGFSIRRIRIDSSGNFLFSGLRAGNYKVKVNTFGTNYAEAEQDVSLFSMPLGNGRYSSDTAYVQINLKLDPRKVDTGAQGAATVIFAQDVPEEA